MHEVYNPNFKENFLSEYPKSSQDTYRRVFVKSLETEQALQKDLCEFTKDEIESVLWDLAPLTATVAQSNGRIITSYISWCIKHNVKNSDNNILKTVDNEWFERVVDKNVKLFWSDKELRQVEDFCENAQDAVIIRLYFEGISGKDASEIRNISKDDINAETNEIKLHDESKSRTIKVSDRTVKLLEDAFKEKTYIKRNGRMIESDNVRDFTDLVQNKYVLRNSMTKTDNLDNAVYSSVVYRRLSMISETLGIPYFTGKNILRSGIIHMAKELLLRDGKLEKEHYEQIANRYRINNIYAMKEYCNIENINNLYKKELTRHA